MDPEREKKGKRDSIKQTERKNRNAHRPWKISFSLDLMVNPISFYFLIHTSDGRRISTLETDISEWISTNV